MLATYFNLRYRRILDRLNSIHRLTIDFVNPSIQLNCFQAWPWIIISGQLVLELEYFGVERGIGSVKRLEFHTLPREGGWDYIYLNDNVQGS